MPLENRIRTSRMREDPLIHLDTEECVTDTDRGFAERAAPRCLQVPAKPARRLGCEPFE